MRVAQYLVIVVLGIGGLLLGDVLGPLTGIVYDWHLGMEPEYSRAVLRFHGVLVGACTTLPMLIGGRLFRINELLIFAISIILGTVFFLLPSIQIGELFTIYVLVSLPFQVGLHITGSFAPFGAMFLIDKLWSLRRAAQQV